jgi:hypothetical protein
MQHRLQLPFLVALAVLLAAGIMMRSWGVLFGTLDFWGDEAWWAENLDEPFRLTTSIRPLGYLWICRELNLLGNPELFLRLPSYFAGIGILLCLCLTALRLYRGRLVILFIVLVAVLHPKLLVFAKEYKPYSLEAFVQCGLTLWAIACYQRGRVSAAFWITAGLALPFCYNVVFLYPAILLALAPRLRQWLGFKGIARYFSSSVERKVLLGVALAGGLACLAMYAAYGTNGHKLFWGAKYGVFPLDLGLVGTLLWYVRKTWLLLAMPGSLHEVTSLAEACVQTAFVAAYVVGVARLARQRRYAELALLCGPPAIAAFANMLGFWPYGDFRANLFLVPGALLVAGLGFDWLADLHRAKVLVWAGMLAFLLLSFPAGIDYYKWKWTREGAPSPQITQVLDELLVLQAQDSSVARNVIIADWHSWRTLRYYLGRHPQASKTYAVLRESTELVRGPLNELPELERLLVAQQRRASEDGHATRVWLVVTKLDRLAGIRATPLVQQYSVRQKDFATHDATYHPQLTELRFR